MWAREKCTHRSLISDGNWFQLTSVDWFSESTMLMGEVPIYVIKVGVWCVVSGVWCVVCGVLCVVCGVLCVV